jgi:uncharacterized protein (TIGR02271 family)
MTNTGREPSQNRTDQDDLEAQAADDFYHDRPAAVSAQVYDSRPESGPVSDLPSGGRASEISPTSVDPVKGVDHHKGVHMITTNELGTVPGSTVYGADGKKIGTAGQVYLDDQSGEPEWVTVNTGLFGTNESFVPLRNAEVTDDGLTVPYSKDQVKDAPNVDPDNGHLDESEEQRLFSHYDLTSDRAATQRTNAAMAGTADYDVDGDTRSEGRVGHDTSGRTTDEAMTRSEEQLQVGTETREAGRARLRKYVVTEEQNVTVPVTREEVRIEREPITDGNREAAMSGPDLSEEEHEVVLHEEQVVVDKQAVPVERVRLDKEQVTEQETVSEQVRQERIEAEGDGLTDRS